MRLLRILLMVSVVLTLLVSATVAQADHFPNQSLNPDTGAAGSTFEIGRFFEHQNGGGGRIRWYGGAQCTGPYTDIDYTEVNYVAEHAVAEISSHNDYAVCDTKFWKDPGFVGSQTAWLDAPGAPENMPTGWNDAPDSNKWT